MRGKMNSSDPDIRGSLPAIRRAARSAKRLAAKTHTPVYVLLGGRVLNLNPARKRPMSRRKRTG